MLKLYHGANSVCSIKARIVLAEKRLEWESHHIDLPNGEQFSPEFLRVNPRAIVPVLDHDGALVHESSVISEYVDGLSDTNPLMPTDPLAQARTRTWGIYTLEYHDSVNTLTFASYQRAMLLAKPPEELAARYAAMPDQIKARKLKDLVANGPASDYVQVAFSRLTRMCSDMEAALQPGPWLMGERFGLADAMIAAYFYRLDCVGVNGLWESRYPRTTAWYTAMRARPSLADATDPWVDAAAVAKIKAAGQEAFVDGNRFAEYLG